ncbi:MAG: porin [Nitrospinaceae bacterium]|nr:porin [Nitrospina sp.]MBT5868886.1 porin [Nitrospinaceae bacterium]MBT6346548.1 porin [Nitrospina sp.]
MRRISLKGLACIALIFGLTTSAHADSALELIKDIEVHGFASSSYSYNFDQPSDKSNRLRVYDFDDNSFKFDNAEIVLKKDAANIGDVGFRLDMTYGFSGPQTNKAGGGPSVGTTDVSDDDFDLQIAFVQYNAPIGNGLLIDFGKFATHIGAEVMDGYDGWNSNFSRSFLFNYGPFTHTGVRMQYALSDTVGLLGMISNGQDNQTDTNAAKGFGGQVSWMACDNITLLFNYFGSAEEQVNQANNSDDYRHFFDVVADISVTNKLSLNLNYVYGTEDNARGAGLDAQWWGFSGIARYDVNNWLSLNLRGQFFDDSDGFRSSTVQQLASFTFTPEVRINNNMVVRAEYRHDDSSATPFIDRNTNPQDTQDTVAFNALFYF